MEVQSAASAGNLCSCGMAGRTELRAALKHWEHAFCSKHGAKPTRADIDRDPAIGLPMPPARPATDAAQLQNMWRTRR